MRKLQLFKEALLVTILILITVFFVSFFPIKFELVKPIKQDFGDFDIYDLHYEGMQHSNTGRDTNIVIVQIGDDRKEIVEQLKILSRYKPAVIGIDVDFPDLKRDTATDVELKQLLHDMPEIVSGNRLIIDTSSQRLALKPNFFDDDSTIKKRSGYFNFIGEEIAVVRNYLPFNKIDTGTAYAFTSRIIEKFNPRSFEKLKRRGNRMHAINYTGNTERYTTISREELVSDSANQYGTVIKDKIVLLGILHLDAPFVLDDYHFTPMNEKITGKSFPDTYGVVIHANVLSMIIAGNYIKLKTQKFSYLVAGIFVFLMTLYQIRLYKRDAHISHWKLILIQLISIILVVYIFYLLFSTFYIKVELLPVIIAIVISVEMFGVFYKLANWLLKKLTPKPVTLKKKRRKK